MNNFTFVSYTGPDAGRVLVDFLKESEDREPHDLKSEPKQKVGFQPNPEPEEADGEVESNTN